MNQALYIYYKTMFKWVQTQAYFIHLFSISVSDLIVQNCACTWSDGRMAGILPSLTLLTDRVGVKQAMQCTWQVMDCDRHCICNRSMMGFWSINHTGPPGVVESNVKSQRLLSLLLFLVIILEDLLLLCMYPLYCGKST